MKNRVSLGFILLTVLVLFFSVLVNAQGESVVKKVTVYPDRAMVTRDLSLEVGPGRRSVVFVNLPTTLDKRSVRVSGKGTATVKILDVQAKTQFQPQVRHLDIKQMEQQVKALDKQMATLVDRQNVLEKSEKFLEQLMDRTLEAIAKDKNPQTLSLDKYKQMSVLLEERLSFIYDEKRKISWQSKELEEQRNTLRQEMSLKPDANPKESCNVVVEVEVKRAGALTLSLSYLMAGAAWSPAYDLHVASDQEKDSFIYSAYVRQQTGEDWLDALLTLSTAKPMELSHLPSLKPIFLDLMNVGDGMISGTCLMDDGSKIPGVTIEVTGEGIKKRTTYSNENGYYRIGSLPEGTFMVRAYLQGFNTVTRTGIPVRNSKNSLLDLMIQVSALREEVVVTGKVPLVDVRRTTTGAQAVVPEPPVKLIEALTQTSTAMQGQLSTSFAVMYKNTVNSGIEPKKVTLLSDSIPVEKEYIAVPALSPNVILKARLKNTLDAPLVAGPANIFFDGSFINTTDIRYLNPGDSFDIPLGIDQAVEVVREPLEKESTVQGLFKKTSNVPLGYRITVRNKKSITCKVKIMDQIPVSKNEKVKVKIEEIKPQPEKIDTAEEDQGLMTWYLTLAPGEEKVILVKYTISYPKNTVLDEG